MSSIRQLRVSATAEKRTLVEAGLSAYVTAANCFSIRSTLPIIVLVLNELLSYNVLETLLDVISLVCCGVSSTSLVD